MSDTAPLTPGRPAESLEMPEVSWLYRRIFTFALTAVCCGLVGYIVSRLTDAKDLRHVADMLLAIVILLVLVYILGCTATDLRRLGVALESKSIVGRWPPKAGGAP